MKKYKDYLFEDRINVKEFRMFFSNKLIKVLESMQSNIAKELLDILKKSDEYSFSYVDLTDDIETVSILPVNRLNRIDGIKYEDIITQDPSSVVWGKYGRQTNRVGAFATRLLPEYAGTKELENFVNEFKSKLDFENYTLKIVEGEEIRRYYHVDTYYNPTPGIINKPDEGPDPRSVLMKSCLKQPEKQGFFDIYVKNPDNIKMLIMLNKKEQLVARSLIWYNIFVVDKPESPTKGTLLDRIYYTNESNINIFIDYAKKNGWLYKTHQVKDCSTFVFNGAEINKPISTRLLNHGYYNLYPYIDTLCFYTPETGRIANSIGKPARNPKTGNTFERLLLQRTNGGFKRLKE